MYLNNLYKYIETININIMKISYINLITLISCFFPVLIKTHSIKAGIILFNGILFHTHIHSKLLFYYDIILNGVLITDTYYYNPHVRKRIAFACFLTFMNFYIMYGNNKKYSFQKDTHDIIHSLITHIWGSYLLYLCY